jgi:protein-S-isoprenylcysteine O-methyltransferase Ste14
MVLRVALAAVMWLAWVLAFLPKALAPRPKAVVRNTEARWGIILVALGFFVVFNFRASEVAEWRIVLSLIIGALGIVTVWTAIRHLDKQWRIDAGLNADHELIRTGPYSIVRHPIYAGMLAMLLAMGLMLSWWWAILIGLALFILGTEIRVRVEDSLLRSRFGAEFESYASHVPAYLPFLR